MRHIYKNILACYIEGLLIMVVAASFVTALSLSYVLLQYLRYYSQWTCNKPILQKYSTYNLRGYAIFSLLLCLYAIYCAGMERFKSLDILVCHISDEDVDNISVAMFIFLLTKIVEMQDIIIWELLGNTCSLNFRVHHNTTLIVTFIALRANNSANLLCLASNTFMHFLLGFYLSQDMAKYKIWFWMVRSWGFVQLFVGLFCGFYAIYFRFFQNDPCYGEFYGEIVGILSYFLYLFMFIYDISVAKKNQKSSLVQP